MKNTLLFILLFSISLYVSASNENHSFGAAPAGMANAYVMASDIWSIHHNQAGLAFLSKPTAGLYFENRYGISELGIQSAAFALPVKSGTFGTSITHFGYSTYNETKVGFSFAKKFGDAFSAGIQFDYINVHLPEDYGNKGSIIVEAGFIARPITNLSIGAHVYNPTRTKLADYTDERIPTIFRVGAGYNFSERFALNVETEKDLENDVRFKTGLEYMVVEKLFLRTGIATSPNQNYFGIGYEIKNFKADLSFSTNPVLPMSSHISLVYSFN